MPDPSQSLLPSGADDPDPGLPTVDRRQLAELRSLSPAGDPWLIRELIRPFLHSSERGLAELRSACRKADAEQIERLAHNLKGACGTVGVRALAEIARHLMESARAGHLQGVPGLLERYAAEHRRVAECLLQEFPDLQKA